MAARTQFWGAPSVSQFASFPYLIASWVFGLASCQCGITCYLTIAQGHKTNSYTAQRKGKIIKASYLGFGFWDIKYAWRLGPKSFIGDRILASGLNSTDVGEFLLPTNPLYNDVTKVGNEVTVHYSRDGGDVSANCCLQQGVHYPMLAACVFSTVATGLACVVSFSRLILLIKFSSVHSTQEGLTLLKKTEMHNITRAPGPSPLEEFLQPFHVQKRRGNIYSKKEYDYRTQADYENANQKREALEITKDYSSQMADLRKAAHEETSQQNKQNEETIDINTKAKNA